MIEPNLIQALIKKNEGISSGEVSDNFLSKILLPNFRNFYSADIKFQSPLTAIVGRNGTGKSTLLHLAGCAFAPPIKEGQSKGNGKSFNHFIPESHRDKMSEKSEYGFAYGAGSVVHRFIWYKHPGGKRQEWDPRYPTIEDNLDNNGQKPDKRKDKRKRRPVFFIGLGKVISNVWWFHNCFNVEKGFIEKRLLEIGSNNPIKLGDGVIQKIGEIVGRSYKNIYRRQDPFSEISENCSGYLINDSYSELASGSGEVAIIRMIDVIMSAPKESLIIIDEPEAGILMLIRFRRQTF